MNINKIAVLTSGGDAPGMNAAIRGVTRYAIYKGLSVEGIVRGYGGLLDEDIKPLDRRSVGEIIQRGGTFLRTARCLEFIEPEVQKKAAEFLRERLRSARRYLPAHHGSTALLCRRDRPRRSDADHLGIRPCAGCAVLLR